MHTDPSNASVSLSRGGVDFGGLPNAKDSARDLPNCPSQPRDCACDISVDSESLTHPICASAQHWRVLRHHLAGYATFATPEPDNGLSYHDKWSEISRNSGGVRTRSWSLRKLVRTYFFTFNSDLFCDALSQHTANVHYFKFAEMLTMLLSIV